MANGGGPHHGHETKSNNTPGDPQTKQAVAKEVKAPVSSDNHPKSEAATKEEGRSR